MNAPANRANLRLTEPLSGSDQASRTSAEADVNDGADRETQPAADDRICWVEVREAPYPPDQQVELLHLQAEAEALLLQLQTLSRRQPSAASNGQNS